MSRFASIPGQLAFDDPALAAMTPVATAESPAATVEGAVEADAAPLESPISASPPLEPASSGGAPSLDEPALQVEVIRSKRRKKTAQARLLGSTVEIRIPARCSRKEEQELVEHFTAKFERARSTDGIDLDRRARQLADRFGLPRPSSIRWVGNQQLRWGSCTPSDGTIRLSDRLAEYPSWVLDYVIVHELAHLVVAGHNAEFWRLVDAYPLTERARGFLIAKGLDGD